MSIWQIIQKCVVIFVHSVQDRIKQARIAAGLTQKDMADALGISQPGYQQMESGARPDMRISTLIKICEILNESADWLLDINTDLPDATDHFYIAVIDLICSLGEEELIEDKAIDELINGVNNIRKMLCT